jgi:hypothetical protein
LATRHIQGPEFALDPAHERLDLIHLGNVPAQVKAVGAKFADTLQRFAGRGLILVIMDRYTGSLSGEDERNPSADATGTSRDESELSFERHLILLLLFALQSDKCTPRVWRSKGGYWGKETLAFMDLLYSFQRRQDVAATQDSAARLGRV